MSQPRPSALCTDCKHFGHPSFRGAYCRALEGKMDPVDGHVFSDSELFFAGKMRMTLCGWDDPKLWEPK